MAKNMTRKGLALGAAFAMVGSAVVATPAHAVDPVSLSINAGTSLNVFAQETVNLKALFTDAGQAASENLKYKIVDASEKLNITATQADADLSAAGGEVAGVALDSDKTEVIDSGASTAGTANYLTLVPATQAAGSEESFSVVVTAWMDFDGDDTVDAGEASATTTVNFLKYSDVTASWNVIDAEFGTTALKAEATFAPVMNTSYIANLTATVDGAATVAEKASTENTVVVSNTYTTAATIPAGDLTFAVLYDSKEVGSKVVTVADTKVSTVKVALADTTDTTTGGDVRTGTTSGSVVFTMTDSSGDAVAAGIRTDVSISTASVVATGDTLTVAGKTVANANTAAVTATLYTDANGQVVVPFSSAKGTLGNKFVINASASGVAPASALTVEWKDAAYTAMSVVQDTTLSGDYQVTTTVGASVPVSFKVEDQFGLAVADSYFVSVAHTAGTRATTNGSFAGSANFSGNTASINIVDNGAGTGGDTYTATLVKRNTNGTTTATGVTATVDITFATSTAVTAITVTENAAAVTLTDGAADLTASQALTLGDLSAAADVAAQKLTFGTSVKGALVTVSSDSGVTFKVHGKSVYSAGSITLNADSTGAVAVTYLSNTAGDHTITVSSGGKTVTLTANFDAAAEGTATSLVVDAPSYITPGKTMTITATLTDKYGNPVKTSTASVFSLSYDGPGLIVGTIPSDTDADGKATFKVLLGSNETEAATVTASYDVNGTDNDIATTATIAAFGSAEVATWTKNLNDGTVKMYAKNIVGAGKVQFMLNGAEVAWVRAADATDPKLRSANGSYYLVRTVDLVEGQKNVLEIYVDGVRTTRTAYTY